MKYIVSLLILLCGTPLLAEELADTNAPPIVKPSVFPKGVGPIHPEAFKNSGLWRAIAKTDPPEDWDKVITPSNREKYPASFTLRVRTNGPAATFYFTFTPTNHLVMFRHVELFEPDTETLNSPRAEKGLVSIMLDSHSTKGSNTVSYSASFTYPTNRVPNAYLRVNAFPTRLWPISLDAFLKKPDTRDLPVHDGKDVKIDISI